MICFYVVGRIEGYEVLTAENEERLELAQLRLEDLLTASRAFTPANSSRVLCIASSNCSSDGVDKSNSLTDMVYSFTHIHFRGLA